MVGGKRGRCPFLISNFSFNKGDEFATSSSPTTLFTDRFVFPILLRRKIFLIITILLKCRGRSGVTIRRLQSLSIFFLDIFGVPVLLDRRFLFYLVGFTVTANSQFAALCCEDLDPLC